MSKGTHAIKKLKVIDRYLVLLIIAALFMGIAYASITTRELTVSGDIEADAQEGVFISDIKYLSNSGADTENSKINQYIGTMMDSKVVLGSASSSTITYEVSIYNNSGREQVFIGMITDKTDPTLYSNPNIDYTVTTVDGQTPWETGKVFISPNSEVKCRITFKYTSGASKAN